MPRVRRAKMCYSRLQRRHHIQYHPDPPRRPATSSKLFGCSMCMSFHAPVMLRMQWSKLLNRTISYDAPLVLPVYPLSTSYFKLLAWAGRTSFSVVCASLLAPLYSSSFTLDRSGEQNAEQNRLLLGDPCHEIFQRCPSV